MVGGEDTGSSRLVTARRAMDAEHEDLVPIAAVLIVEVIIGVGEQEPANDAGLVRREDNTELGRFAEQLLRSCEVVEKHRAGRWAIVGPPAMDPVDLTSSQARELEPHALVLAKISLRALSELCQNLREILSAALSDFFDRSFEITPQLLALFTVQAVLDEDHEAVRLASRHIGCLV
jgi:hypothetical protein